jgi:hypothetical protein
MGNAGAAPVPGALFLRGVLRIFMIIWAIFWLWIGLTQLIADASAGWAVKDWWLLLLIVLVLIPAILMWWWELAAGIVLILEVIAGWIFLNAIIGIQGGPAASAFFGTASILMMLPALVCGVLFVIMGIAAKPPAGARVAL